MLSIIAIVVLSFCACPVLSADILHILTVQTIEPLIIAKVTNIEEGMISLEIIDYGTDNKPSMPNVIIVNSKNWHGRYSPKNKVMVGDYLTAYIWQLEKKFSIGTYVFKVSTTDH